MSEELKVNSEKYKFRKFGGITLISLVITIVVLIILAGVAIYLSLGNNGIFNRAKQAKEATNKQEATDIINLKITTAQMNKYAEKQQMPTLKELSEVLRDDEEITYVTEKSQVASTKYEVGENPSSIFTKLNKYPYEFEINNKLQLASIDGIQVATNNNETSSSISYDVIFEFDSNNTNKCANAIGTYTLSLGAGKNSVDDYKCLIVISQGAYGETEVSNTIWNFPNEKITKKNYTGEKDNNMYYQYCNSVIISNTSYYIRYSFFDKSFEISSIGSSAGWSGINPKINKIVGIY